MNWQTNGVHWAETSDGWVIELGHVRGVSPGKHGPDDYRWEVRCGSNIIVPTHAEALLLAAGMAWTQRKVFNRPPRGDMYLSDYLLMAAEANKLSEVIAWTDRQSSLWKLPRGNR